MTRFKPDGTKGTRPNKVLSRNAIVETCKPYVVMWGKDNTCYIALCGFGYKDADLVHKELGISYDYIASAENDATAYERAVFSKPTPSFQLKEEFNEINMSRYQLMKKIIWLDTNKEISTIMPNVSHMFLNMVGVGSIVFITWIVDPRCYLPEEFKKLSMPGGVEEQWQKDVNDLTSEANKQSKGLQPILGHCYNSVKGAFVFVAGFEVIKLNIKPTEFKDVKKFSEGEEGKDNGGSDEFSYRELERLALIKERFENNRRNGMDKFIPFLVGMKKEDRNKMKADIRSISESWTDEDRERVEKDFPDKYRIYIPKRTRIETTDEIDENEEDDIDVIKEENKKLKKEIIQLKEENRKLNDSKQKILEVKNIQLKIYKDDNQNKIVLCKKCRTPFEIIPKRGRPRKFCLTCCRSKKEVTIKPQTTELTKSQTDWHSAGIKAWETRRANEKIKEEEKK
jgi:hypothetical protein